MKASISFASSAGGHGLATNSSMPARLEPRRLRLVFRPVDVGQRQSRAEDEVGALARLADAAHVATHRAGQLARDRQAEADALGPRAGARTALDEDLEHPFGLFRR